MHVTLNGICRRGLCNWRARERWIGRRVLIWSGEHQAWGRPECCGYTTHREAAGIYLFEDAFDATIGCGPEKKIEYVSV